VRIGVDVLTKIGIDFIPTTDRLRIVTANGQNFRLDPNSGAVVDGNLGGSVVDGTNTDGAINGGTTTLGELAYTNNEADAAVTTLYTLDPSTDSLFIQNPPNSGSQTSARSLSQNSSALDVVEVRGFDIPAGVNVGASNNPVSSGSGVAILEYASNSQQRFATVDLASGDVSQDALVGPGTSELLGLSVQSNTAPEVVALSTTDSLIRFRATSPNVTASVSVSGLTSGESLVAIDFRPATGQLFGLGINASLDTGTLYRIDPRTGASTVIGSASSIAFVDSTTGNPIDLPSSDSEGYDMAFNPTVDRVRVVTTNGLNFRVNPSTGAPVDGSSATGTNPDTSLNGQATSAGGTSYTNSYGGASVTTQYNLDPSTDSLYIQSPPNSGTMTLVGSLSMNFVNTIGFDIPSNVVTSASSAPVSSGIAYAALTSSGITGLYTIDLTTANATNLGPIAGGFVPIRGLAVGQIGAN
jgi:hypothetical protein